MSTTTRTKRPRLMGLPTPPPQPPEPDPEDALDEAWGIIADGYGAALKVPGIPEDERAGMVRQHRLANKLACRPPFACVGDGA